MTEKKPYGTVLIKADQIIEFLYGSGEPQTLASIAQNTGLTRPTALKILDTLEQIGYVLKNKKTRTYSIGFKLIKYSTKEMHELDLEAHVTDYLGELHDQFDETVHLGVFQNDRIVTVHKFQSSRPVVCVSSSVGDTKDLYSSGMGKAVLAELDKKRLSSYIAGHEFVPKTERTIAGPEELLAELEEVRSRGYSIDNEENEEGVYCLGASIVHTSSEGQHIPLGAFSISIPVFRANEETVGRLAKAVLDAKKKINASFA